MSVSIIHDDPPNLADIEARLGPLPDGIIFSYAPHVYVPSGVELPPWLEAHEAVHMEQQGEDPEGWWARYLTDDAFRLEQEVEAHRAEWDAALRMISDRNRSARVRMAIARRLASPMYGKLISPQEAVRLIKGGES